jgi:acyl-CoA synthetase (AMP-forming)/AMP-acid ligase II
MATVDEDGYFFIVDRKKDMIIRGGYNVYPREIEEVLYEHPAVREVAVVGIPHDELGEEIGAAVALKDGATATPEDLRAYVKEQSPPTSTPVRSGSSTIFPRALRARSSSARSSGRRRTDPPAGERRGRDHHSITAGLQRGHKIRL